MTSHNNEEQRLERISALSGYSVEDGDPDPRGWTVVTTDGRTIGEVVDLIVDTEEMKVQYLDVQLTNTAVKGSAAGDHAIVEASDVDTSSDTRQVIVRNESTIRPAADVASAANAGSRRDAANTRVTRAEEELKIGTREVQKGEARITKHVESEHVRRPVTTRREELVVERRPVEASSNRNVTIGEDEIRVPLRQEEVVVEKRPVVKEEIVVGKRVVEDRDVVETDVRRERVDVEGHEARGDRKGATRREDY